MRSFVGKTFSQLYSISYKATFLQTFFFFFFLYFIIFVMINCEWCQHRETMDIYVLYLHHWSVIYSSKLKWNDSLANGGQCTKRMKQRQQQSEEKKKNNEMYEKCFYYDDNSWLFECVSFIPLDGCVEKSYDFLFLFVSFPFHQCKHIFTYFKCLFSFSIISCPFSKNLPPSFSLSLSIYMHQIIPLFHYPLAYFVYYLCIKNDNFWAGILFTKG